MAESEQDGNPVKADSADDDTDEESEVLEESPCGRWQKRREEVCHLRLRKLQEKLSQNLVLNVQSYKFLNIFIL